MTRYRVRPVFAWYDLWVGVFVDRHKHRVYVFPLPCLGVVIERGKRTESAALPRPDATPSDQEAAEAYEACNPHLVSRPEADAIRSAWIAGYWQAKAQMSAEWDIGKKVSHVRK